MFIAFLRFSTHKDPPSKFLDGSSRVSVTPCSSWSEASNPTA